MIGFLGIGTHSKLRALLSSYVDGEVSAAEARQVESHLAGCEACQRDLHTLRATVGLLSELPALDLPRSFQLQGAPAGVRPGVSYVWGPALATSMAAVLLTVLLLGDASGFLAQTGRTAIEAAAAASALPAPAPAPPAAAPAAEMAAPAAAMAAPAPAAPAPAPAPRIAAAPVAPTPTAPQELTEADAPVAAAAAPAEDLAAARAPRPASPERPVEEDVAEEEMTREAETLLDAPPAGAVAESREGLRLPLRELEVAAGAVLLLLTSTTLWLVRRRRWSP